MRRLAVTEANIPVLEKALAALKDDSNESVLSALPGGYKLLPSEYFFPEGARPLHPVYDTVPLQAPELFVADDLRACWGEMPYRANDYHAEEKTVILTDGLRVRTKSEASLIEIYRKLKVQIHYDELLTSKFGRISPDIIALRADGIVPWDNLIVTYDIPGGGLDMVLAEAEIKAKLLL